MERRDTDKTPPLTSEQNFLLRIAKGLRTAGLIIAASAFAVGTTGNCVDLFSEKPNHTARAAGETSVIAVLLGALSYMAGYEIKRRIR